MIDAEHAFDRNAGVARVVRFPRRTARQQGECERPASATARPSWSSSRLRGLGKHGPAAMEIRGFLVAAGQGQDVLFTVQTAHEGDARRRPVARGEAVGDDDHPDGPSVTVTAGGFRRSSARRRRRAPR